MRYSARPSHTCRRSSCHVPLTSHNSTAPPSAFRRSTNKPPRPHTPRLGCSTTDILPMPRFSMFAIYRIKTLARMHMHSALLSDLAYSTLSITLPPVSGRFPVECRQKGSLTSELTLCDYCGKKSHRLYDRKGFCENGPCTQRETTPWSRLQVSKIRLCR